MISWTDVKVEFKSKSLQFLPILLSIYNYTYQVTKPGLILGLNILKLFTNYSFDGSRYHIKTHDSFGERVQLIPK